MRENHTWMIEEEENKVEALETVALVEDGMTKTTRIRTTLRPDMRTRLIKFLKENIDMPGISPKIIQHKLNVDPERKPVP